MSTSIVSKLKLNEIAEVVSFKRKDLELKLLSMGCIPGERICIERKALFGDPILVRVSGSLLSLRKVDAR